MSLFSTKCSKLFFTLAVLCIPSTLYAQDNVVAIRPFGQHTVAFSATPTFDAGSTTSWKITLTGNVTGSTLVSAEAGQKLRWEICQDGTGGRTFVWPSQLISPISIISTANVCTIEIFEFDGTNGYIPTTATGGGGGSGTVNSGTVNQIAKYTAATTVSSDGNLDDGLTTANTLTYLGTGGISSSTFNATGTGAMTLVGTEGTCSGAAIGKDVLCLGDAVSHSIQGSLNGSSFFPYAQHQSTSPTSHGIMVAETFPQIFALSRGAQGQALCEGAPSADPGYCSLNLAGGSTIIQGIMPKVNHPASTVFNDQVNTFAVGGTLDLTASTVASAFKVPVATGLTTIVSGAIGYDSTNNLFHGGQNSADSYFVNSTASPANNDCAKWVVVSGNKTLGTAGAACGAGGSGARLDQITAATASNSINNGDFAQTWNASLTTAGKHWFTITENSASTATGTPYLLFVNSIASSTALPFATCSLGTANCWNMNNSALWAPLGTANLALPGTTHGVVVGEGTSTGVATTTTGNAGQVLISNGSSADPTFQDPVVSQAFVNLWNAQDITVTRTSANVRNPIFSQSATLQLTFAGITGSPSGCTLQFRGVDSQGNVLNNGGTVSISPANGTTSQTFVAASTLQTAAQVSVVYACSTYPTAGTLTLDFTPIPNVDVTNTIASNVSQLNGTTTDTNSGTKSAGTLRVVIATDQPTNTNNLNVAVNAALPAGSALIGEVTPVATATTTDATSTCYLTSAASTNSTSCKGSAGNVYGVYIINTTTTNYFLRMYNSSSAPTCSSATGFIETIPALGGSANGGGISRMQMAQGYATGIGFCLTGGGSSTDNTNAATGVYVTILYK